MSIHKFIRIQKGKIMIMDVFAFGMPGGIEWVMTITALLFSTILPLAFWNICSKAGYPGILGLLVVIPIANIFLVLFLAFADWPALKVINQTH